MRTSRRKSVKCDVTKSVILSSRTLKPVLFNKHELELLDSAGPIKICSLCKKAYDVFMKNSSTMRSLVLMTSGFEMITISLREYIKNPEKFETICRRKLEMVELVKKDPDVLDRVYRVPRGNFYG